MKDRLIELAKNAYAPYTNFHVASIVIMKDGKTFEGVNVEDASTRAGTCAERNAIFAAITAGYHKGDFSGLHVMCVDSDDISACCFVCRQLMVEFFDNDTPIICYNKKGETREFTIADLCPYPFDEDDLK